MYFASCIREVIMYIFISEILKITLTKEKGMQLGIKLVGKR